MTTRSRTIAATRRLLTPRTSTTQPAAGPSGQRPTPDLKPPEPHQDPAEPEIGNEGNPDDGDDGDDGDGDDGPPSSPDPLPTSSDPEQRDYERFLSLVNAIRPPTKQKAKIREPDTFDGSDPRKLRSFLALCQLNFKSLSSAFPDDASKVNYTLSYLKGTALEWFEPALTDPTKVEIWMTNWQEFVRLLQENFGPANPVGDAEEGLDSLRMREGQRIAKYNVEFNRLAASVNWGDSPLRHAYYKGLPDRIKDSLVHVQKPTTLSELRLAAQLIDIRYWERRNEKTHDPPKSDNKPHNSDKASDNRSPNKKPTPTTSGNKAQNSGNNNSSNNSGNTKKGPDLSDKLGKDGKLTSQERQRRFNLNLCMFCGRPGHVAKDCPKSTSSSSKAKARSAKATEEPKK